MQYKPLIILSLAFIANLTTGTATVTRLRSALTDSSPVIKKIMKDGCSALNIRSLDPFTKEPFRYSQYFRKKGTNKNEGFEMLANDFTVKGHSDYIIINQRSESTEKRNRTNIDVLFPQIQLLGQLKANVSHSLIGSPVSSTILVNIKLSDLRVYFDIDVNLNGTIREILNANMNVLLGDVAMNNFIIPLSPFENDFLNKYLKDLLVFVVHRYLNVNYNLFDQIKDELAVQVGNLTVADLTELLENAIKECKLPH